MYERLCGHDRGQRQRGYRCRPRCCCRTELSPTDRIGTVSCFSAAPAPVRLNRSRHELQPYNPSGNTWVSLADEYSCVSLNLALGFRSATRRGS
jgi:hypothetical protein